MSFRIANHGRISLISGSVRLFLGILGYFLVILKEAQKQYPIVQISDEEENGVRTLKLRERYIVKLLPSTPSRRLDKSKKKALLDMLTKGGKRYGFIGYRLSENKANILDLQERNMLFVTAHDDYITVMSRNPTPATESIKHLHREIVEHIHPYVQTVVERIRE